MYYDVLFSSVSYDGYAGSFYGTLNDEGVTLEKAMLILAQAMTNDLVSGELCVYRLAIHDDKEEG